MLGHCSLEVKTNFQITLALERGEVQLHRALWPACGSVNMYFQLKPQKPLGTVDQMAGTSLAV